MQIEHEMVSGTYRISMIEDRTASRWRSLAFAAILSIGLVAYWMYLSVNWLVVPISAGIVMFIMYSPIRNLFSVSTLEVTGSDVRLERRLFFLKSKRCFAKADIEWIGYAPEIKAGRDHQDSGLSLMVRSDIMPVMFARTITTAEAAKTFADLAASELWIAKLIRPIGQQLF